MDDHARTINLMAEQWEELRTDLFSGKVHYTDVEKLKNYTFFKVFSDIFADTSSFFEISLGKVKHFYRAVNEEHCKYERLVPNIQYATSHNRMNPPGKVFLYAGFQDVGYKNHKDQIIETCLKEIRAPLETIATVCKFKIKPQAKLKKVIDICGDDTIPKGEVELNKYLYKSYVDSRFTKGKEFSYQSTRKILAHVYFNFFSSEKIFKPVDKDILGVKDVEREYAPFHSLAHFIQNEGYAGIIFKSTVANGGKNLVLFDVNDATYVPHTMEIVKVSEFLAHD